MSEPSASPSPLSAVQIRRAEGLAVRKTILSVPGVACLDGGKLGFLRGRKAGLRIRWTRGGGLRVRASVRLGAGHAAAGVLEEIRDRLAALQLNIMDVELEVTRIAAP